MPNPWDNDPVVSPAGPVYGSPRMPSPQTPAQAQGDQLGVTRTQQQIEAQPLQNTNTRVNIEQGQTSIANTAFTQKDKLRSDFQALPPVKTFSEFVPALFKAIQAGDNAGGDLAVLYAFSKSMDPTTGVREGEQAMARDTASLMDQANVWINKVSAGNRLPPSVRQNLVEVMRETAKQYARSYDQQRGFYTDLAKRNGFDPNEIVGPHAYAPFFEIEKQYIEDHGGTPKADGVPLAPPVVDGRTEAGFDKVPDERLKELSPAQAKAYDAWWAAHPNPTPDQLRAFGASMDVKIDNADAIIEAKKKTGTISHGRQYVPDISDTRGQGGLGEKLDAGIRGAADAATFGLADKAAAVGDTLTNPDSTLGENLARQYAISDYDTQNHFPSRVTGQAAGSLLLPMGEMKSIPQIAAKGAALGGGYGVGSSRSLADVPGNALRGAAGGAAIGSALAGTGKALGAGVRYAGRKAFGEIAPEQRAILDAGAQEGVPVNMADVFPQARNTVGTLESMPGASGPVQKGLEAGSDAMGSRVSELGRGGTPRENMGEAVQDAGRGMVKKANRQASRLYDRARDMAGNTPIEPVQTKDVLADLVVREAATPGGTRAGAVIKEYAGSFKKRALLNIDGARRMRTELLDRLRTDGGLSKGEATRITGQIMGAVNRDIEAGLAGAGKTEAAKAYRFADKFYAQSREEIEQNIQKFIGTDRAPKSVEQTLAAMQAAAGPKGNAKALTGMLARMSKDERADYAATLAESLGRASPDEAFSPSTFLTQVRKLSPAARRIVFGSDGEKSIQNLMTLAAAKKATVGRLNNSRSGMVTNYRSVLSTVLFGLPGGGAALGLAQATNVGSGATGMVTGAAIGATGIALARSVAKALMNEEFTRAIARAPATVSPKAIDAHFGILRKIAARDPNVRSVVEALEKKLLSHANDNLTKAAAASDADPEENK